MTWRSVHGREIEDLDLAEVTGQRDGLSHIADFVAHPLDTARRTTKIRTNKLGELARLAQRFKQGRPDEAGTPENNGRALRCHGHSLFKSFGRRHGIGTPT